ncbi:MAG TPA: 6-phosphogluconolactonase [Gammaproteobacteria bacterium]
MRWTSVADTQALRQIAYRRILAAARRAIERHGRFIIVLAGGNTPREVYRMLRGADAGWSRLQVYFGDERCLPVDDTERGLPRFGDRRARFPSRLRTDGRRPAAL